jgi:hypothetical protein
MALVVKDRVQETSTTTGTGSLTLLGAVTGFQTFSSAIGNTNTTYYTIQNGAEWEVGVGTVSAGALSRDTVLESSNGGSLVNFSAGSKFVFCTYPAEKAVYLDENDVLSGVTIVAGDNAGFTLQDNVDATKKAQFELSGITTGTTRTYTLPNVTGTLAALNVSQTFTTTTTFSGLNVTVGTATGNTTYGLGTGATLSGSTKAINIGTAGVSGSTTNVNIGSAVSGSTTNVTANGTWTYPNNIVGSITGNAATVTNGLYTSDIGSTVQAYDANTTKNAATQTLTNKTISGSNNTITNVSLTTSVTGTLPVLNGGTGVTTSTGSGNNVLSTSPTLVTPALGTPSSGNLANCTFPTLNQDTTGSAATVTGNATGSTFGFNSGYGSVATAYGCRVWVNFNGTTNTGGFCTIRGSGNVTSVSDLGTGNYRINFTTAMPDVNYCATLTAAQNLSGFAPSFLDGALPTIIATTALTIETANDSSSTASLTDMLYVYAAIFR